jgi:predicted TIM-barrel fold metal-dependent hydrolase
MDRRTFLGCGAMAAAAVPGSRVVDAHVHFYDPERAIGVPWPSPRETVLYKSTYPERYVAATGPFKSYGVVAVEASSWLEDNLWLLEVAERAPLVLAVVGNIPPAHPDYREALERYARHPLFRGIRVNAGGLPRLLEGGRVHPGLKLLAEEDLALDVLLGGAPALAETARLAAALPELRIVLGHLPVDAPADPAAGQRYREGLGALARCSNVYAKVSGVVRRVNGTVPADAAHYRPALDKLWEVFGPDRVIYASNWPVCEMLAPYPVVFSVVRDYLADKGRDMQEKYFWRNAEAAYKWRTRAQLGGKAGK